MIDKKEQSSEILTSECRKEAETAGSPPVSSAFWNFFSSLIFFFFYNFILMYVLQLCPVPLCYYMHSQSTTEKLQLAHCSWN